MTQTIKNKILKSLYLQKSFGFKYAEPFNIKKTETTSDFMSKDIVKKCSLCDASKISNNKIYDFGDENSKIIFITTVPTFDTASKDMFVKMVENVLKIKFENIYLISIVKCDIDEKNSMLKNYAIKCKGYILNQISISNAKIIVTLGDSYNYLLDEDYDIASIRGKTIQFNNKNLMPIYHPSFLLRNPSLKKEALDDLQKIRLLMEE